MSVTGSASEAQRKEKTGRRFLGCFFSVFLLMGLGFSWAFFIWPVVRIMQAKTWRETRCTILSSSVESHRNGDGGPTYSVSVTYEYFVDDHRQVSTRYKFMGGSSSGYDGKAEIVRGLPAGTRTVCYVNPSNPAEAVL